jgi:hypothetical protein
MVTPSDFRKGGRRKDEGSGRKMGGDVLATTAPPLHEQAQ